MLISRRREQTIRWWRTSLRCSASSYRCRCGSGTSRRGTRGSSSSAPTGSRQSAPATSSAWTASRALLILLTTLMGAIAVLSSWNAITDRVKEYYIVHAGAADGHAWRLRVARLPAVLPVLGSDAGADVLPHRDLGRRPPALLGDQVLSLHARRKRGHAAWNPGAVFLQRVRSRKRGDLRHHAYPAADRSRSTSRSGSSSRSSSGSR